MEKSHWISWSVTVKALHSGCDVFSQTVGFFSVDADVCPVMGAELMCRALAMVDSSVSSLGSGPTPTEQEEQRSEASIGRHAVCGCMLETYSAGLWAGPWASALLQ